MNLLIEFMLWGKKTAVFLSLPFFFIACQPTARLLPTRVPIMPTALPQPTQSVTSAAIISPTPTSIPPPTRCAESGKIETAVFHSPTTAEFNYRIYTPPCYGQDGRLYPTLYMLPGNGHTDEIWDTLGLDEIATRLIQAQQIPPLIIVMADGGRIALQTSGGEDSYETVIFDELIPHIEQTVCAWNDPNGRAIGGVSRGGYWALEIAFRHPEQFVSVGGHSASLLDISTDPTINPQQTGLSNDLADLRIYFDIGQDDTGIENIQKLHEEMETAVIPHSWIVNEGGHDNTYWRNHIGDYLIWYSEVWSQDRSSYPHCP